MKLFVYSCSQNYKRHADPIVPPGAVQEATLAAGESHRQSRLWAGLLRAQALLPPLPADSEELHDDDQHEGLTSALPPPGVASLQVRGFDAAYSVGFPHSSGRAHQWIY